MNAQVRLGLLQREGCTAIRVTGWPPKSEENVFGGRDSSGSGSKSRSKPNQVWQVAAEIVRRLKLAVAAPSAERELELQRERAYIEQQRLAEEYSRGYLTGWRECYDACLEAVDEELSRKSEIWAAGAMMTGSENFPRAN